MKDAITIIQPEWVITVNSEFEILTNYAVVIEKDVISNILPIDEISEYSNLTSAEIVNLPGQALMPGMINTHTHAAMSLFRGLADDLPLMEWLNNHIWPAEGQWITPQFIAEGTELACAEMVRSGTTCFNDMYFHPDITARCAQKIGIRAVVGLIVLDFPTVWANNADEYLNKGMAVNDELKDLDLISGAFAPHAPYTVSDNPLEKIAMYSNELDIPVHMHIHETAFEVYDAEKNTGMRPLERLDQLNLLTPNLIAVHMTEINESEIERLAEAGVNIAHCPESNQKLASGICPIVQMKNNGINVSLGTDGAASNNDLDMFLEMRSAALQAKVQSSSASSCAAREAIEMATINGAKALGQSDLIGSIEIGKKADLVSIDLNQINTMPVYDPVAQIVYSMNSRQVDNVWINGILKLSDGKFQDLDPHSIIKRAGEWGQKISSGTINRDIING